MYNDLHFILTRKPNKMSKAHDLLMFVVHSFYICLSFFVKKLSWPCSLISNSLVFYAYKTYILYIYNELTSMI